MSRSDEGNLQQVIEGIVDYAIFTTDVRGTATSCNKGVERLLGYRCDEFVGLPADAIFTPEDVAANAHSRELETARETGQALDDRWHVRKDGSRVWVNGMVTPIRSDDGIVVGFVKIMRDQTDEKLVQDALARSESQYRSILEDVMDVFAVGVFILDSNFDVVWVNRAVERFFGLTRERAVGRGMDELGEILGRLVDEPADFSRRLQAVHARDSAPEKFEIRVRAADGRGPCWLEYRSEPIQSGPYAGGRIEHYYDITERREAAAALAAARDALEEEVRERTASLVALNKELESFNYSVSHDLRSPLRGLTGFSQILLEEFGDKIGDRGRHYVERVKSAADRMGDLIEALLALSRVSRADFRVEEIDLSAMAEAAVQALRERDPDRRVEVRIEPGVAAKGDRRLLRVVLDNLVENAWKFTRDSDPALIEIGQGESGAWEDVFYVRDNGAGFDSAYVEKLFVPFQRLHSPRDFSGMGIGLATVQRIVNRHGGRVWGEGTVGEGATFYVALPARELGKSIPESASTYGSS